MQMSLNMLAMTCWSIHSSVPARRSGAHSVENSNNQWWQDHALITSRRRCSWPVNISVASDYSYIGKRCSVCSWDCIFADSVLMVGTLMWLLCEKQIRTRTRGIHAATMLSCWVDIEATVYMRMHSARYCYWWLLSITAPLRQLSSSLPNKPCSRHLRELANLRMSAS